MGLVASCLVPRSRCRRKKSSGCYAFCTQQSERRIAMTLPRLMAGASGYSFKEWKGTFYPDKIDAEAMLPFYSERLPTVEINNTFYRMPKTSVLDQLGEHHARGTSASRSRRRAASRTSRDSRSESAADSLDYLYNNLAALGDKRGPVLFQLPPNLKKDLPRLDAFLALLPDGPQRRVRVPQRHLVRRRRLRGAARPRARRCACPSARTTRRRRWSRPRPGATCGFAWKPTRTTTLRDGRPSSRRRPGARSTSTSCTSRPRPRTRGN